MDTPPPPLVTGAASGITLELLEYKHLPDRALLGSLPAELVCPGMGQVGRHAISIPHGSVPILSPAATLKSKQDELHRKALQTLQR